jgi:hypothetical protein
LKGDQAKTAVTGDLKNDSSTPVSNKCKYFESGQPVKSSEKRSVIVQPKRIEDYEPGSSSLSADGKVEVTSDVCHVLHL